MVQGSPGGAINVALSWHADGKGIQMLTVPKNAAGETWAWRQISAASQDEQLSVGDIGRDVHLDLLLGTKWLRGDGKIHERGAVLVAEPAKP